MAIWLKYMFRHGPLLSGPIANTIKYDCIENEDEVQEKAVHILITHKYCYMRYSGLKSDDKSGLTECMEFDTIEEALKLYEQT